MTTADTIIKLAEGEVGYHEGKSNGHWNNKEKYAHEVPGLAWVNDQGQPWCAVFVSWLAEKAGVADLYPRTASTVSGAAWFRQRGEWSEYPAVPAQVFYGSNGHMEHTGIVYDYDDTYVYTIEGNTNTNGSAEGDGVYRKKRLRRSSYVQGYGYPKGLITKTADPKRKADARVPVPPVKVKPENNVQKAHDAISEAIKYLQAASPDRHAAKAQIPVLQKVQAAFADK